MEGQKQSSLSSGHHRCFMCPNIVDEFTKQTKINKETGTKEKFYRIKTIEDKILYFCSEICFDWYVNYKYNGKN